MQWPGDGYTDDFKDDDADLEAGFARPREPIRVTMVQDEELGGREGAVLEESGGGDGEDDDDAEKELPPPPPAYGLWRSSVVCTPLSPLPSHVPSTNLSPLPFVHREPTPTSFTGNPSLLPLATRPLRFKARPVRWY